MAIRKFPGPSGFQPPALVMTGVSILIFIAMMSPYRKTRAQMDLLGPQVREAVAAEKFDRYCALEIKEVLDLALVAGTGNERKIELNRHSSHIGPVRDRAREALAELRASLKSSEHYVLDDGEGARLVAKAESVYANLPPLEERILEEAKHSDTNNAAANVILREYLPWATQLMAITEKIGQDREGQMEAGISRLSGELDGIMLYSGPALQRRTQFMDAGAAQSAQCRAFVHLFAQQLINAEEYLLTGNDIYPYRIRDANRDMQNVLVKWQMEERKDPEPDRTEELKQLTRLTNATDEFRSNIERMLQLMAAGNKAAANHLIEKALDPIIYPQILALGASQNGLAGPLARANASDAPVPLLATGLAERDEQELLGHVAFIERGLNRAMWITAGLLLLVLVTAIGSTVALSR